MLCPTRTRPHVLGFPNAFTCSNPRKPTHFAAHLCHASPPLALDSLSCSFLCVFGEGKTVMNFGICVRTAASTSKTHDLLHAQPYGSLPPPVRCFVLHAPNAPTRAVAYTIPSMLLRVHTLALCTLAYLIQEIMCHVVAVSCMLVIGFALLPRDAHDISRAIPDVVSDKTVSLFKLVTTRGMSCLQRKSCS
jgi:hypothetical protein